MAKTGAELAAESLADLTERVYGLCGGHIQPIWDAVADTDASIIDTRDERAAVHGAHADAEVTGDLGVALVTAGPGFTNALTGIANASTFGTPLLIVTGYPPVPQFDRGALQSIPHRDMSEAVTVTDRTVYEADRVREYLFEAAAAALDERGPAVVEIPTDVLRATATRVRDRQVPTGPTDPAAPEDAIAGAADALRDADRPVAVLGRGSRDAAAEIRAFVESTAVPVLTTAGSKGVVPESNDYCVPGARGDAMGEADCYLLLGKRLDFTLGYGSPAVYGDATFVQVDVDADALRRNRTPDVAVRGTVPSVVSALTDRLDGPLGVPGWAEGLQTTHEDRAARLTERKTADDTPIHPYRVCGAIERAIDDDAIVICDGGDALSFGRVAIPTANPRGYLDPGPLGCLGVGLPFAIGASLAQRETDVVCFTGDGSLGFNLADLETAVRQEADVTIVVANNAAWNIERYDQLENYDREVGSELGHVAFDEVAAGLGADGVSVSDPAALDETVERAVETDGPVVVDVPVDTEAVSPDAANGLARVPEYQPLDAWDDAEREYRQG
ncbi:thiamine pyrophosphate-binding protein [Halosolutus amylolyticus]|uniref:Thiamine pyrophosphate-binding protein n=1 Tax=Halosolutus amylolyticus TaxID=2932267 RepID=A0ABD5PL37_9EURY|nr:thiamine pyrophosphate-binding protein [Halosolutus amylolyticus]